MYFLGLGTATPAQEYSQAACWEAVRTSEPFTRLGERSRALLRKVLLGQNGMATRRLALTRLGEAFELTPAALHKRFTTNAVPLASLAGRRALTDAGVPPGAIDAVVVSTCTGYLCPGLSTYVSERLGLRADVLTLDLVGQGCGAAVPNWRTAQALLASGQGERVLSICVEVCSAAFFLDDDPGVLVSACLFGDGAGAAVLGDSGPPVSRCVEWRTAASLLAPQHRASLRFEQRDGMLRNVLRPEVPSLAGRYARAVLEEVLRQAGIARPQITAWILHPGGRDVLAALKERLELDEKDLVWSAAVLSQYGNLSSASVFFVLQEALQGGAPPGYWWVGTFGAGFSCHGALLRVA
jgi:alkylresorcinol/alkylpyrone synthase